MPFTRAPRLRAFDYIGRYRYSLTLCVKNRQAVFISVEDVDPLLLQIQHAANDAGFAVIAYCFMPDHLHLLVEGLHEHADMREFVKRLKQRTSFVWKKARATELWQRGYVDHVLRDEEDMVTVARYILGNPVRAEMADEPSAYPLCGSLTTKLGDLLASL